MPHNAARFFHLHGHYATQRGGLLNAVAVVEVPTLNLLQGLVEVLEPRIVHLSREGVCIKLSEVNFGAFAHPPDRVLVFINLLTLFSVFKVVYLRHFLKLLNKLLKLWIENTGLALRKQRKESQAQRQSNSDQMLTHSRYAVKKLAVVRVYTDIRKQTIMPILLCAFQ